VRREQVWRRDGGAASAEASILMPIVMLLMLVAVQIGLVEHARQSAIAAAQAGGQDAASVGGTVQTGQAAAETFLDRVSGNELYGTTVQVSATEETVTVVVTGSVVSLLPGLNPHVTGTAQVPVERLTW